MALSQIMFTYSVLYTPLYFIDEVKSLIKSFMWPKKVHVKHSTVIAPICEGGLRLPDFRCKIKACKVMWIQRVIKSNRLSHFAKVFGLPLSLKEMCFFNYDVKYLENYKSSFYKQLLEYWYELQQMRSVKTIKDVRSQSMWFNKDIIVGGRPVFDKTLYNQSLRYINDIINERGIFLSIEEIRIKYGINMRCMFFNSLKDAIPPTWRSIVKSMNMSLVISINEPLCVYTREGIKLLSDLTNKHVYWTFVCKEYVIPTSNAKWESNYPNHVFEWKEIFLTPYKLNRDTKIQSLQFRIIHRFFPCNYTLNTWYHDQSSECSYCGNEDTLEHYFVNCPHLKNLWNSFFSWWYCTSKTRIQLTSLDIILGIANEQVDVTIDLLNYCILLLKAYIYDTKEKLEEFNLYEYQIRLKKTLEYEQYSYMETNKIEIFNRSLLKLYEFL